MKILLIWLRITFVSLLASACVPKPLVIDRLDPLTGVTITQTMEPFVLYRIEDFRQDDDRDLVYVGALQVNRMGDYRYFLWLGILSVERYGEKKMNTEDFATIEILANNYSMKLEVTGRTPASIGMSGQMYEHMPEWTDNAYYEVSLEQLRTLALANTFEIRTTAEIAPLYETWSNEKQAVSALREFIVYND